jgi:hypothetical protein
MVAISMTYPEGARFMPLIVGIPGMALCALQLFLDWSRSSGGGFGGYRFRMAPKAGKVVEPGEEEEFGPHTVRAELTMIGYFVGFIGGLLLFGFYLSVPIMLVTYLRRVAEASWRFALTLAAVTTLVMYLMFGALLHIELHTGYLTRMVLRAVGL